MADTEPQVSPPNIQTPAPLAEKPEFRVENGVRIYRPLPPPLLLFVINARNGSTCWVEASPQVPVSRLKRYIELKTGVPPKEMILIYKGEALVDANLLKDCKLQQTCSISLLDVRDTPTEMNDDLAP